MLNNKKQRIMKKTLFTFTVLAIIFGAIAASCSKDEDPDPEVMSGEYSIVIDGELSKQGTTTEVGRIKDDQGDYVNTVTIGTTGEISIVVSGFPKTIGSIVNMDESGDPGVNIVAGQDYFGTVSGTITRTSADRISFTGKCSKLLGTEEYDISGFVESELWEVIK